MGVGSASAQRAGQECSALMQKVTPGKAVPHAREMVAAVGDTGSGCPWTLSKLGAWSSRGRLVQGRLWLHPQTTGMLCEKYIRRCGGNIY